LDFNLQAAGFEAQELKTECVIVLADGAVTASNLNLQAKIEGISAEKFEELVHDAEVNCPISKLLNCKITVSSQLC